MRIMIISVIKFDFKFNYEYSFYVNSEDTVRSLKLKFAKKAKCDEAIFALFYNSKALCEHLTLAECHIREENTIYAINLPEFTQKNKFVIQESDFSTAMNLTVLIDQVELIEDVKYKIQDLTGIPSNRMKLVAEGKELMDYQALMDTGVPLLAPIRVVID
eukprot:CAMPEP_0168329456 /NCGR_PEP_ID=MMETSP0213-20121227/7121_1 /TAXON_ID=151035 /ORGANISM="Euplotes harpa, Strain FSP1.4" /LENGTH=159 /DNA_ID=CAMNT_0008332789 /DNA_START=12 /DNA_END=491 /DNA_ORIENTATION=-